MSLLGSNIEAASTPQNSPGSDIPLRELSYFSLRGDSDADRLGELEDELDLDGGIEGKDGDADGAACMLTRFAEDLAEQF